MSGFIGMTTRFDFVPYTEQLTMSDKRDFSRPRPSLMEQDFNLVSDEEIARLFPGVDIPEKPEPEEKPEAIRPKPKSDSNIKTFQRFFSKPLPVVGSVYSGPTDGIYNDELGAAARAVEAAVSKATGASAAGLVFNSTTKTFNTSPGDITSALKLVSERAKTEKSASIRQRIDFFRKIIAR